MALGDWTEKQLLGLTAAVVGGVLVVMGGMLLWIYLRYKALIDEIDAKNAVARTMQEKAKTLPDVEAGYKAAMARFHEVLKQVPDEPQITDLNAQLSEQAAMAKLKIVKIEPVRERGGTQAKTTGKLKPILLRIEAEGSFNAFGQFLDNIEMNMDRFVAVTGFRITAHNEGLAPGKGPHKIVLDLLTYAYVEKKPVAAARNP